MTTIGRKYKEYMVVSWLLMPDNTVMNTNPNPSIVTAAVLRSAFGPGYQFGGVSDYTLRVISRSPGIH